jgi:hypothetical protein
MRAFWLALALGLAGIAPTVVVNSHLNVIGSETPHFVLVFLAFIVSIAIIAGLILLIGPTLIVLIA